MTWDEFSMKFVSLLASQNRIRPKTPVHFRPLLLPVGICHHSVGCLWSIGWMTFRILGSWWSSFTSIHDGSCRTWTHSQPCTEVNVFFSQKKITSSNILGEWNYPTKMWFHQVTPSGSKLSIHQPPQHNPSWCACSDTFQVFQHIDRLWKRASCLKNSDDISIQVKVIVQPERKYRKQSVISSYNTWFTSNGVG